MTEWQDISTAPMDWTTVLLFENGSGLSDFRDVFEGYYEVEGKVWMTSIDGPINPTHWMPLPTPPVQP